MHGHVQKIYLLKRETQLWSDFESDVLEGRYPLGKLVRTEGRCAWYESRSGDKPVLISLTESLNDEATLLERLKAAGKVHQQNVAEIFESGATVLQIGRASCRERV